MMKFKPIRRYLKSILLFSFIIIWPQTLAAKDAGLYYDRGTHYLREGELKASVIELTKAISLRPDYADAYNNRGLAHYKQNNFVEAKEDFLKAIQFKPADEKAYSNVATVFCKQGDYEQALRYLSDALALGKKRGLVHADLYNNLGFIYMKKGMHKEATDAYNLAIRITQSRSAYNAGLCDQIDFNQRIEGHSVIGKFYAQ
jgi:tetratricopeptide (TPR) repeat protein